MIRFANGGILIQSQDELPEGIIGAKRIFLDFETRSGDPKKDSLNPWKDCYIAGVAFTFDEHPHSYYLDYRATRDFFQWVPQFVQNLVWNCAEWINHNIKYDMHVATNCLGLRLPKWVRYICTVVQAKLKDSDRNGLRGGYGLDALSKYWLKNDISQYEQRLKTYLGKSNKDYGTVPADIIAEYGCQDPLSNRDLFNYLDRTLPERCRRVAETEIKVTYWLWRLECKGMPFDEMEMRAHQFAALMNMNRLEEELHSIVGFAFRPNVNNDCHEVLCGKYGLEPVKFNVTTDEDGNEELNASYDKHALAAYKAMPYAPHDVILRIIEFRKLAQRNNLFFGPLLDFGWKGCLHPTYNQCVRTGRMSCSQPNAQQFDAVIASLIKPPPGYSIISTDASQIELRLVIHYIQDLAMIAAYQKNPDLDNYQGTADFAGITRSVAKTVVLGTGYGEGMKKLIGQLKTNPDVVKDCKAQVEAMNLATDEERLLAFDQLASEVGKRIYNAYHASMPTLKTTAKRAEAAVKGRRLGTVFADKPTHYYGYITNLYGRDRHLPYAVRRQWGSGVKDPFDRAWLAFPTVNQATAADIMKEQFVALCEAIDTARLPIDPFAVVHDEIASIAPSDLADDPQVINDFLGILECPSVPIDVPIRWSIGVSSDNWLDASEKIKDGGKSHMRQYDKSQCTRFTGVAYHARRNQDV